MIQKFIDLHASQSDALFRYCFFKVSNREQAVDMVQDSFLRLWDMWRKDISVIKNPKALLFRIASNIIIDWYRKKKTVSLDALLESENRGAVLHLTDEGYRQIEIASEGRIILDQISLLDPTCQQVVYLRLVEDLPPKEIATIVGLSVNVVSVRINRGIQELRKKNKSHE